MKKTVGKADVRKFLDKLADEEQISRVEFGKELILNLKPFLIQFIIATFNAIDFIGRICLMREKQSIFCKPSGFTGLRARST